MNKSPSIFLLLLICALILPSCTTSVKDSNTQIIPIIESAEIFFVSLKEKKYGTTWKLLSKSSQKAIINSVYEAFENNETGPDIETISNDFASNGLLFNSYWDAFITTFDPDLVLKESRWEIGPIDSEEAEVIILHKKADLPVKLRMFSEKGAWKVGFTETFWTRKF